MNTLNPSLRVVLASILLVSLTTGMLAAQQAKDKSTRMELVSITGEVTAVDPAARTIRLRGPLGGEISGKVSEEVKNLAQIKVGELVTIAYYESLAISVKRKGETTVLFKSASGDSAEAGERPAGYSATTETVVVTVVAVDAEKRSLVVQNDKGVITGVAVAAARVRRQAGGPQGRRPARSDENRGPHRQRQPRGVRRQAFGQPQRHDAGGRQWRGGPPDEQHHLGAQRAGTHRQGRRRPEVQVQAQRRGRDGRRPGARETSSPEPRSASSRTSPTRSRSRQPPASSGAPALPFPVRIALASVGT